MSALEILNITDKTLAMVYHNNINNFITQPDDYIKASIPHRRNNSIIKYQNVGNRRIIDINNMHIHGHSMLQGLSMYFNKECEMLN